MPSPSHQLDASLARAALDKRRRGQTPTRREAEALRRIERAHEEAQRWACYATIPGPLWREMADQPAKTIADQAQRYGLPFAGALVDLPKVVRALHDFLAKKAHVLAAADADDPLLVGGNSPALERYRDAKAKLANRELAHKKQQLLPRRQVCAFLAALVATLQAAGEPIGTHSIDALRVLAEALENVRREFDLLAAEENPPPHPTVTLYTGRRLRGFDWRPLHDTRSPPAPAELKTQRPPHARSQADQLRTD